VARAKSPATSGHAKRKPVRGCECSWCAWKRERIAAYRAANRERIAALQAASRATNRAAQLAADRAAIAAKSTETAAILNEFLGEGWDQETL